jgi:hypothetical protein
MPRIDADRIHADNAARAATWLREDSPLSPPEQDAVNAMRDHLWILWHANDHTLAVILMLSRLGLLRDRAAEQHADHVASIDGQLRDQASRAAGRAINRLSDLIEATAARLESGESPQDVAVWLRAEQLADPGPGRPAGDIHLPG